MVFPIVKKLMDDYKYLIIIRCKTDENFEEKHIPSFICNKRVAYLMKSIQDVKEIIEEIFLVWRFKYHLHEDENVRIKNIEYMEKIIKKINDLKYFPDVVMNINSGIDKINCWFKIYPMNLNFIDLLDLTYKENKPELFDNTNYSHKIIPYLVYKDKNPNRLLIHITQNCEDITRGINQTFLQVYENYNLDFYVYHFDILGLKIKNIQRFLNLIKSGKSFLMTCNDFESNYNILYANIYVLTHKMSISIENNLKYLKMCYVIKMYENSLGKKIIKDDTNNTDYKMLSFL